MRHVRSVFASAVALSVAGALMLPAGGSASISSHVNKAAAARAAILKMHIQTPNRAAPRRAVKTTKDASVNWSGFADVETNTSVTGSWAQPSVKCSKEARIALFWVGLDGWTDNVVEQAGTLAQCFEGTAFYYTWWEMFPTNNIQLVGTTLAPGDAIHASVTFAAAKYTLAATDSTHSANSFSIMQSCGTAGTCLNSSAEWIAERPSGNLGTFPLAQFSTWTVTGATSSSGVVPHDQIFMVDGTHSYYLAKPSAFTAATHSFTDKWQNSY